LFISFNVERFRFVPIDCTSRKKSKIYENIKNKIKWYSEPFKKIMVSSANIEVLTVKLFNCNPVKVFIFFIAIAKHSMHKINIVGERGSPFLTPLWT